MNKKCQPNYGRPGMEKLTPQALDLMKKMLDASSKTRLSCAEALQHVFFKMTDKEHDVNYSVLINDYSHLSMSKKPPKEPGNEERFIGSIRVIYFLFFQEIYRLSDR